MIERTGTTRRRRATRGFTLLEVLLAISIILLLSGSMFLFYDFSLRSRQRAQASAEEAQLARVVLDQMAQDLMSISSLTATIRARTAQSGFVIQGSSLDVGPGGAMVGWPDSVAFLSCRYVPPSRFATAGLLDEEGPREDRPPLFDVNEVRWYWPHDPETGASGGLIRTNRPALLLRMTEEEKDMASLASADLYETELADRQAEAGLPPPESTDDDALAEESESLLQTEIVAPTVQWIYLRYYTGSAWTTDFVGGMAGASPTAVEITIGFEPLLTEADIEAGQTLQEKMDQLFGENNEEPLPRRSYRRVVYLASGEPFLGTGTRSQRSR